MNTTIYFWCYKEALHNTTIYFWCYTEAMHNEYYYLLLVLYGGNAMAPLVYYICVFVILQYLNCNHPIGSFNMRLYKFMDLFLEGVWGP